MNSLSAYILSLHPKKVTVITSMYPPYPKGVQQLWGGTEVDIEDLVSSLRPNSIQIKVISLHYTKPINKKETNIARIGTYTPYMLEGRKKALFDFLYKEFFRPLILIRLIRALKLEKPDLVVIGKSYQFSLAIYIACRVLDLPYIIRYDWSCPSYPKEKPCKMRNAFDCPDCIEKNMKTRVPGIVKKIAPFYLVPLFFLKRYFWNRSIMVVVVNQFYRSVAMSFGVNPKKIMVIPPRSELILEDKKIEELQKKYKKEEEVLILYAGRLEPEKGINILLDAIESPFIRSEKIKLMIAGTGRLSVLVEERAKNDKRIIYVGLIPHKEIGNYYAISDIIAIPSIVPEGHPLVAEESGSLGKIIIGFNMGGLKELSKTSENIMVVEFGIESLASGIKRIVTDLSKKRKPL